MLLFFINWNSRQKRDNLCVLQVINTTQLVKLGKISFLIPYKVISSNITSDRDIADYISTEFYELL
jgi:hypothetical protein